MPFHNVFPQACFHETVGCLEEHSHENDAEGGKEEIHPLFIQQVHPGKGCRPFCRMFMCMMPVVEQAGDEGGYENEDTCEHCRTFPSPMPFRCGGPIALVSAVSVIAVPVSDVPVRVFMKNVLHMASAAAMMTMRMYIGMFLKDNAFCVHAVCPCLPPFPFRASEKAHPGAGKVYHNAAGHGYDEKQQEQPQSLAGHHGQHHERLVARGCYHHRNQGAEPDYPLCVERHCRKPSYAARNQPEQ